VFVEKRAGGWRLFGVGNLECLSQGLQSFGRLVGQKWGHGAFRDSNPVTCSIPTGNRQWACLVVASLPFQMQLQWQVLGVGPGSWLRNKERSMLNWRRNGGGSRGMAWACGAAITAMVTLATAAGMAGEAFSLLRSPVGTGTNGEATRFQPSAACKVGSEQPAVADSPYALVLAPPAGVARPQRIVLLAGDEEYRSEEALPMLGKILSQQHGFHCTVLFSVSADGTYIDANHQPGVGGLEALADADLLIISTRFRRPSAEQAEYLNRFLLQGKPVIGLRTATHAFTGRGSFGDWLSYDDFGIRILGERWISHHGGHKVQGARSVVEPAFQDHPILSGVDSFFAPSDVYGVVNLTDADQVLLRGAVTETLEPDSPNA